MLGFSRIFFNQVLSYAATTVTSRTRRKSSAPSVPLSVTRTAASRRSLKRAA